MLPKHLSFAKVGESCCRVDVQPRRRHLLYAFILICSTMTTRTRHQSPTKNMNTADGTEGIEQYCISCKRGTCTVVSAGLVLIELSQDHLFNQHFTSAIAAVLSSVQNVCVLQKWQSRALSEYCQVWSPQHQSRLTKQYQHSLRYRPLGTLHCLLGQVHRLDRSSGSQSSWPRCLLWPRLSPQFLY